MKKVVAISTRRRRIGAIVASAALAVAAGLVMLVSLERAPGPVKSFEVQQCTEASTAQACITRGQFDGVITLGPGRELLVPRYDLAAPEGAVP